MAVWTNKAVALLTCTNAQRTGIYRCRNGQCIPLEFLRDGIMNPDCLDKTDELDFLLTVRHSYECSQDPAFRCEEQVCRDWHDFACGDGECSPFTIPNGKYICSNHRGTLMSRAALAFSQTAHNLSHACWTAAMCLIRVNLHFPWIRCEEACGSKANMLCARFVRQHCPREFTFPRHPVMLSHVRFIFTTDETYFSNIVDHMWMSDKICYQEQLCDDMFNGEVVRINGSICRLAVDVLHSKYWLWELLTRAVRSVFNAACSSKFPTKNETQCNKNKALFQCPNSKKCISTHRLLDGFVDCTDATDEKYNNSCSLTNQHRFRCKSDLNICVSSTLLMNNAADCPDGDDEIDPIERAREQRINFPTLCDGFRERRGELLDGQIMDDETDCEPWECNNQYTRCDGFYNCVSGADELFCREPPSICSSTEQPCLSPTTNDLTCLPFARAGDNVVDCLGGTDERTFCRRSSGGSYNGYRCWNESTCIPPKLLCSATPGCSFHDDQQFCYKHGFNQSVGPSCHTARKHNRSVIEDLLCSLNTEGKRTMVYFSLQSNQIAQEPPASAPPPFVVRRRTIRRAADDGISQLRRAWYCNRGIVMLAGVSREEERCLCPPAYYGDRCQYQSQRVSLTVQFIREIGPQWRSVFHILLMLINDDSEVESHDSIIYVPVRDCTIKFNVYLLYRTRPKNPSSNYSVRIDAHDKNTLEHHVSWRLTIPFEFLPVNRLATRLVIPQQQASVSPSCPWPCIHGQCTSYANVDESFCRCFEGWSGLLCNTSYQLRCSPDSINVDSDILHLSPKQIWATMLSDALIVSTGTLPE